MRPPLKSALQRHPLVTTGILLLFAFIFGYLFRGCGEEPTSSQHAPGAQEQASVKFYTCSMHPQIQQPNPGTCPLCAMDLIPVYESGTGQAAGVRQLTLSPEAVKLADIQTAPVERKYVSAEIRMDGMVAFDETRLSYITAWVPGRIERLFVDYTGVRVSKADHLVSLYSPELLTTQKELLLGLKMLKGQSGRVRQSTLKNVEATREKLRLWGLTTQQIRHIEKSGNASDQITIYSPISGIVVNKNGFEGMYVKTGTRIYTVADLSQVWIKLDAYESDLTWLRYGQQVEFETKAYPGELFTGRITFIDPTLDPATRTVKVRVNVPNPNGKLKPDMFVTARVYPQVAMAGAVMEPELSGKWICPMHPEIIKNTKNTCNICGMDLVTTESLGYVAADRPDKAPLVIPASAPLITGKRAVVYVAAPEKGGVFEGREITLGPRAGDFYIVKTGLDEGEKVVVNGSFKLDSAVQILAKPSMMNPEGGHAPAGHHHGEASKADDPEKTAQDIKTLDSPAAFKQQIDNTVIAYYTIQQALSLDKYKDALAGIAVLEKALQAVDMKLLHGKAHMLWMQDMETLKSHLTSAGRTKTIEELRSRFEKISDTLYAVTRRFGTGGTMIIHRFHCPMAFNNRGAYWLQMADQTENPYYGSSMFRCGVKKETIAPGKTIEKQEGHRHE